MKTIKFLFAGIFLLLFVNGFNTAQTETKMKRQIEKNIQTTYTAKINLNYLLYLPKDYDSKDKWPLMIFLHGSGERGSNLELVKRNGPPKLVEEGKDFPFVIISPQCPNGTRWKTEPLLALLDEAVKDYKIDTNRIYITGLSMGGNGTWKLANEISNRLAAIIPVCGWGDPFTICEIGDLPVWVFHGEKDPIVPIKKAQDMVDALKFCKGNVQFTVYPDAGHDSWTETYNNPEVYKWLLEHTRDQRKDLKENWN